jgi:Peptidase family M28/PA domain
MRKNIFVLFLFFALSASSSAQTAKKGKSPARIAAETIHAKQLSDYLYFVASDEMEGRDTPSRGLDTTAKFIGMNLSSWGFKPAGDDGTFYQKIALKKESVILENTKLEINGTKYPYGEEYVKFTGNGNMPNAPFVYVKDGWTVKSEGINPFEGLDVKGKIIVLYRNVSLPSPVQITAPPVNKVDLKGVKGVDWADPMTNAKQKGAVGIIVIASPITQIYWSGYQRDALADYLYPAKLIDQIKEAEIEKNKDNLPTILVSQKLGEVLFPAGKLPWIDAAVPAMNLEKSGSFAIESKSETLLTQNVVAIWEGSDPILKNEMVAIGAHYDHIGMDLNSEFPDKISNGADDDGSGTVAVLSIAEALAKSKTRPKRSILLVWHCGEEKGLWGSEYFNKFPTVDIKQVTAQLNIDMIGRSRKPDDDFYGNNELSGENSIYVIGSKMMSSKLGEVISKTNKSYLKMNYNYRYDDPKDKNRFFFRSDHFNYALNGIPVSFWFAGVHVDYHQVEDEPNLIDYKKMEKVARTIFLTMWELGDLKERPKVDKKLPKELTQQ